MNNGDGKLVELSGEVEELLKRINDSIHLLRG